jgi:hypothetical protein
MSNVNNNTEQSEKVKDKLHTLEFRGRMSLFYHEKRERFYSNYLNWTAFASIIFSSIAFFFINEKLDFFGLDAWFLGFSALVVSGMNGSILAFGMVHKSHEHAIFRSKWVRFLGKVNTQRTEENLDTIAHLEKLFYDITEEEPSTISKDVDWAYNKAIEAMGLKAPEKT